VPVTNYLVPLAGAESIFVEPPDLAGMLDESEPIGEAEDPLIPEVPDAPDEPDTPGAPLAPDGLDGLDGLDGVDGLVAPDEGLFMPEAPDAPLVPDVPELPGVMPEAPPLLGDGELGALEPGEAPAPPMLDDPELPVAPDVPLVPDAASEVVDFFACFFTLCFFFVGFCVSAEVAPPLVVSVEDWARIWAFFSTWAAFAGSVLMVTPPPVEPLDDWSAAKPAIESIARNRASEIFFIGISNINFRW
jgi:hypothetical protein